MRRAARIDGNQPEIVAALRKVGATVLITSQLKNAFDILVGYKGKLYIIEIKDGTKTASKTKLTDGELKCMNDFVRAGITYHIAYCVEDALQIIGLS